MEGLLLFTALCDTGCRFVEVKRPVATIFACIGNTFCYFFGGLVPPSPTHPQDLLKSQTLNTKTHAENARFLEGSELAKQNNCFGSRAGLFEFVHWLPIAVHRTYFFFIGFLEFVNGNFFIGAYCFPPKIHALC